MRQDKKKCVVEIENLLLFGMTIDNLLVSLSTSLETNFILAYGFGEEAKVGGNL